MGECGAEHTPWGSAVLRIHPSGRVGIRSSWPGVGRVGMGGRRRGSSLAAVLAELGEVQDAEVREGGVEQELHANAEVGEDEVEQVLHGDAEEHGVVEEEGDHECCRAARRRAVREGQRSCRSAWATDRA